MFFWTGFDYRGEPTPYGFPGISSQFGILDTCGFPKDSLYYLKAWWTHEDVLHVFPHWNWPGREGQPIEVNAISNADEVELYLNGRSLNRKKMEQNGHLTWVVPYTPGTIVARSYRNGQLVQETQVQTTLAPAALSLNADRVKLKADGRDVAIVTVSIRDSQGRLVPTANELVNFSVEGQGRILGVGNGDPSCLEPDRAVETTRTVPLGTWKPPDPAITEGPLVFEAHFDAPKKRGSSARLLLNPLGPLQSVILNGRTLLTAATPEALQREFDIEELQLRDRNNMLSIRSDARFHDWSERERAGQRPPAALVFRKPAPAVRRSTFNGLAQVIIQSDEEPGEISLEASCSGITSSKLTIATNK